MKKLPISVCITAGAEAHRIGRALASVREWTSEIIVVLNHDVADGTEEIALGQGAQVFREPWKGHIAQKNSAAAKAGCEWLFGLDSDEVVSVGLRDEILALFSGAAPMREDAFSVPRLTFYCGRWIRHGDWYPDRITRLWRRGQVEWGGVEPHGKLIIRGKVARLRGDLLHYSMESINHQIAKTMQYADAFAQQRGGNTKVNGFSDLLIRPIWRFWRAYVFRLGFLDGWQGFAIAWLTAFYTFLRYVRVRENSIRKDTVI